MPGAAPGDVGAVLDAFAGQRLLADGTVEIAHEALLTAWPLLRDSWLAETRADRVILTALRASAASWAGQDRDPAYLYAGSLLEAATAAVARADAGPARRVATRKGIVRQGDGWHHELVATVPELRGDRILLDAHADHDAAAHAAGEDEETARRFGWWPARSTEETVRAAYADCSIACPALTSYYVPHCA
jgi:hypothetical protein